MPQGEVMTRAIVENALDQGKQVFVPYIYEIPPGFADGKPRKRMEMVSLHSKADYTKVESHRDTWGIPSVENESIPGRHKILDDEENVIWRVDKHSSNPETLLNRRGFSGGNLDMMIMPGVAFDRKCGRLGHGKGFYDFFLQLYHDDKILGAGDSEPREHCKGMPFLSMSALGTHVRPGPV